ncbi:uncharacterized protein LOC115764216 [Drosophila novamexicana]|uniref:uncharacterized protein LOC115764216 n=1 Tax=Drosophila novamexicana TaxID=47314 RepID=UPI0011E5ABE3|nr:uncharacterized protein LOC115764216 [Drosophila novamexicana]
MRQRKRQRKGQSEAERRETVKASATSSRFKAELLNKCPTKSLKNSRPIQWILNYLSLALNSRSAYVNRISLIRTDLLRKRGILTVTDNKGIPKLQMDGFEYVRKSRQGSKTYWVCAQNRRQLRCSARIMTCSSTGELAVKNPEHNHEPEFPILHY